MNLGEFLSHIGLGLLIAAILAAAFLFGCGSAFFASERGDKLDEQNLYLALRGQAVEDEMAAVTAEIVKESRENGSFLIEINESEDLEKLKRAGINDVTPYEGNSILFALENWDKITAFLEDPSAKIPVDVPLWRDWFILASWISCIVLAVGASGGYIYYTCDNYRRDECNRWWQYPWNKPWAYPMISIMAPYIVTVQPVVLIYAIIRRIKYGAEELPKLVHKPELFIDLQKKNLGLKIEEINGDREKHRQRWIEICGQRLEMEKSRIEEEIQSRRYKLSDLGREVELAQRKLAESKDKLKALEEAVAARKPDQEYSLEFDQVTAAPHVKAVEVADYEIRIYTDTVFIRHMGIKREIGDFLIRIGDDSISIENLTNTNIKGDAHPHAYGGGRGDFCFGTMNGEIENLLRKRNHLPLIGLIIQALHSYNTVGAVKTIENWKVAKNQI